MPFRERFICFSGIAHHQRRIQYRCPNPLQTYRIMSMIAKIRNQTTDCPNYHQSGENDF